MPLRILVRHLLLPDGSGEPGARPPHPALARPHAVAFLLSTLHSTRREETRTAALRRMETSLPVTRRHDGRSLQGWSRCPQRVGGNGAAPRRALGWGRVSASPLPPERPPGGTPGRRATRPQTAEAPALHGGQCGLRRLPPPQRAHAQPPGTSLLGADAWGASGAPSWRGARGELRWGSRTLSLQLPSCPSLVTLPSPCRGVGGRRASQASTGGGRGQRGLLRVGW